MRISDWSSDVCSSDLIEDHDHEGAGRPADLNTRSAKRRDQEPRDNRGDQSLVGRGAAGDSKRHRERQGDDRDGQAGDRIGAEGGGGITLAKDRQELWRIGLGFHRISGRLGNLAERSPRPGRAGSARAASRSRTPRPCPVLEEYSPSSSMPLLSSAPITFTSVSTTPRTWPLDASIRWIVGRERPASSAS